MADGRVIVTGGTNEHSVVQTSVEIYDRTTGLWTRVHRMTRARQEHAANLLPDGRVTVVGGKIDDSTYLRQAETYDPGNNLWLRLKDGLHYERAYHTTTTLFDGRLLVAGGTTGTDDPSTAEILVPR